VSLLRIRAAFGNPFAFFQADELGPAVPRGRCRSPSGPGWPPASGPSLHFARATRSSRIDSTVPVAAFGVPTASPASTARAGCLGIGRVGFRRAFGRAWRFGRFTSITSTPASVRNRASPAPHEPVPSTPTAPSWPKPPSHPEQRSIAAEGRRELLGAEHPAQLVDSHATWKSLCVSTHRVTSRGRICHLGWLPSLLVIGWGWHAQPDERTGL